MNTTRLSSASASLEPGISLFLVLGWVGLCLLLLAASAFAAVDRQAYPREAPAGLQEINSREFDIIYIKPGFQPSDYGKLVIEEPEVTMQDYWMQRNRHDINERDLQRIQTSTAKILRQQFAEKLSAKDGYAVVEAGEAGGNGVLRLKPSMIDLFLNAPDLTTPADKTEFASSAGHATLYLDLYDAASGELLLRVIDRDTARQRTRFYETNRGTNQQDFRIMASRWATALRKHLDAMHEGTA
jgi:hypothetical protein